MKVSTSEPYQIIYSLFEHEYLGYLFESFVIQLNEHGKLTFKHQNISYKNAEEFKDGLDENDYKAIELMDSIQQDVVYKKFNKKKLTQPDFFLKVFDKEKGDKALQEAIINYVDFKKSLILPLLYGKEVYIMGNDGEPAWKRVDVPDKKASVLFHFRKNEDNTHYFPTIKHQGEKVDFQYNNSQILCNSPAWLLVGEDKILTFRKGVDGKKIKPFLNKKFIVIPEKVEETYYKNFVTQLVASFDVYAKGFEIKVEKFRATPSLSFKELVSAPTQDLFGNSSSSSKEDEEGKLVFTLDYEYGSFKVDASDEHAASVTLEKNEEGYIFHKVVRDIDYEKEQLHFLHESGLEIKNGKATMMKAEAIGWIKNHQHELIQRGFKIGQNEYDEKRYFLGKSSINIEVKENNDWFDIYAIVRFGEFEIPFIQLRNYVLDKQREFTLPNGEIAVIPEEWLTQYSELFAFSEEKEDGSVFVKETPCCFSTGIRIW